MMHNSSHVRVFFLSGFNVTMTNRVALFSVMLLCYFFIVLINVVLIVTIILDKHLHEPMYILLCSLCVNGLYGTTKILWDLLSPVHVISYSGCLVQAFVIHAFVSNDMSILAVMSYDRYVAICRPLVYHSVMSKKRLLILVSFSWFTPFCIISTNMILTSRLHLCSPYIDRLYCMNWIIVKLACFPANTIFNNTLANITNIFYLCHAVLIVWSYLYVIKICVNSVENRAKFMQTCVPHLACLLIFLGTILLDFMHIRYGSNLPQAFKNFIAIEYLVILPMMNPLIYGFKLTNIRKRIVAVITFKITLLISQLNSKASYTVQQ